MGRSEFEPAYLSLHRRGELALRVEEAQSFLQECRLCGWQCGIDRRVEVGPCRTGELASVSTAYVHLGEEKPLAAGGGAGAIFFTNCVLHCQFCQTYRWNIEGQGARFTPEHLAQLMLDLQKKGAANIDLVTPVHVTAQILSALLIAVEAGLRLPLVWNSGGYESEQTLELLDGIIDIYLPDMKYSDVELAQRFSGIPNYVETNRAAVMEMHRQVGDLRIDDQGRARRGLLVRHLVMPGYGENTGGVVGWLAERIGANTYLSLMDQYRPAYRAFKREHLDRQLHRDEFTDAWELAQHLGFTRLDGALLPVTHEDMD